MKLRHIIPALGLATLLTVGCAQSTLAADRDNEVANTEASEDCTEKAECSAEQKAECSAEQKAECSEEQKAECAEKKECPMSSGDVEG